MDRNKILKAGKVLLKVAAWVIGICVVVMVVLQIVLSPSVLTKIVNNVAEDYIEGEIKFGSASVSMFRHFPNVTLTLDSVSLTYPTERFAAREDGALILKAGKGEQMDTLAAFDRFTASLNLRSLIGGTIRIPDVELDKPRIFAKNYADGVANWNIFKEPEKNKGSDVTEEDTTPEVEAESVEAESVEAESVGAESEETLGEETLSEEPLSEETGSAAGAGSLPKIVLENVRLGGRPHIVYCSKPDTLYATVTLKEMNFKGRLSTVNLNKTRIGFKTDSLFVAGKLGGDTLALGMDILNIRQRREVISLALESKTGIATRSMGRMRIPISVKARFSLPKDTVPAISIKSLDVSVAGIPLKAKADVRYMVDSIYVKGEVGIEKCKVKDVIDYFGKNIWEGAADVNTGAVISMNAALDGYYNMDGSRIPAVDLTFSIPDSPLSYTPIQLKTNLGLELWAKGGASDPLDVGIDDFHLDGEALRVKLQGTASNMLGKDPDFNLDAGLTLVIDSLANVLKEQFDVVTFGTVSAEAKGSIKMSQIDPYKFAEADLACSVRTDRLALISPKDSIGIRLDSLSAVVATLGNKRDTTIDEGTRLMAIGIRLDSTYLRYKDAMQVNGSKLSLNAWNDAGILDPNDTTSTYYPFSGKVSIGRLSLTDSDSSRVSLRNSENTFRISPSAEDKEIPVLALKSATDEIRGKFAFNRASVRNLALEITATKNDVRRKKKAKEFIDSLSRVYPDVPKDSLFIFIRQQREAGREQREMPDWLSEEDFRKSDLNLKLDDVMAQYYRDWDFDGRLTIKRASLMTPLMPLRNSLNQVDLKVDNNTIALNSFTLKSGNSNLTASGRITGLRSALLRNGPISVNLYACADSLNVNELLTAYNMGSELRARLDSMSVSLDSIDDNDYLDMVAIDTIADSNTAGTTLFVIPANVMANVTIDAADVTYSVMKMDALHAEAVMKERCIQLVNAGAISNVGGFFGEAFYSTRTKEDIEAGFTLNLTEITADKIIEMMPSIDTLMPMLASFYGQLNLEMAATTQIDTSMNIMLPTLNGVMRISGRDLSLAESEDLYSIAKMLKFKNRDSIHIDNMSVEALINDSKVEIFPFVLAVDRYTMAMSGIQNLDQSFSYHISVLKSPLIIRFGLNIKGNDFDSMKFRIGKAKYKSTNVPAFSTVIDETKLSLSNAIHDIFTKGVDAAVKENRSFSAIEEKKKETGYVNPAEEELEELSEDETQLLDSEEEEAAE